MNFKMAIKATYKYIIEYNTKKIGYVNSINGLAKISNGSQKKRR